MQPTTDDIDYEIALRNYFHYDDEEIEDIAMKLHVSTETHFYDESRCVHEAVYEIINGEKLPWSFYQSDGRDLRLPWRAYKKEAYIIQEFLHDWNDVAGGLELACDSIDVIIHRSRRKYSNGMHFVGTDVSR